MTVRTKFEVRTFTRSWDRPNSDWLDFWVGVAKHNLQEEKDVGGRGWNRSKKRWWVPISSNFSSMFMHFRDIAAFVLLHTTFPSDYVITVPNVTHRRSDRQMDRWTIYDRNTAICTKVHRVVKKVKGLNIYIPWPAAVYNSSGILTGNDIGGKAQVVAAQCPLPEWTDFGPSSLHSAAITDPPLPKPAALRHSPRNESDADYGKPLIYLILFTAWSTTSTLSSKLPLLPQTGASHLFQCTLSESLWTLSNTDNNHNTIHQKTWLHQQRNK